MLHIQIGSSCSALRQGVRCGSNSDVIIASDQGGDFNYHKLLGDIYMNLHGAEEAVDVVLVTPEQVEKYKDTHCLVIAPALKEGREVYHAERLPTWWSKRVAKQGE